MADDEPLDDARAVAMTAAAAAARVVETIVREQQNKATQAGAEQERTSVNGSGRAWKPDDPAQVADEARLRADMDQAQQWAKASRPELLASYYGYSDTENGRQYAQKALLYQWRTATQEPYRAVNTPVPQTASYDSPERRTATDQALQAAGPPPEVRHAKTTADLLNATDPRRAAAAGSQARTQPSRTARPSKRERTR